MSKRKSNRTAYKRRLEGSAPTHTSRRAEKPVSDLLQIEGGYVPGKYALSDWLVAESGRPEEKK